MDVHFGSRVHSWSGVTRRAGVDGAQSAQEKEGARRLAPVNPFRVSFADLLPVCIDAIKSCPKFLRRFDSSSPRPPRTITTNLCTIDFEVFHVKPFHSNLTLLSVGYLFINKIMELKLCETSLFFEFHGFICEL